MSVDTSKPPERHDPVNLFAERILTKYFTDISVIIPPDSLVTSSEAAPPDAASLPPLIGVPPQAPNVGIIGGGIGGLYAALPLQEQGVPYEILEASDHLGGHLLTKRMDAGVMRFPETTIMEPLFRLFRKINLPLGQYQFQDKHGNSTLYYNGLNKRRVGAPDTASDWEIESVPSPWNEIGWKANVNNIVKPFAKKLIEDFNKPIGEDGCDDGWTLMMKYDKYSMKAYMAGNQSDTDPDNLDRLRLMPYPMDVVNWCETFDKSSSWYDRALSETVLEDLAFKWDGKPFDWKYIIGGSSKLATTLDEYMAEHPGYVHPFFNSRVTGISCVSVSDIPGEGPPGINSEDTVVEVQLTNSRSRYYSHVITTTTLPCLRTMDLRYARLDYLQKAVLRMLQYGPSTKIGLKPSALTELEDQWEVADAHSWSNDLTTMGAFAFFGPGDFSKLYPALTCPASGGRLHFSGEVVSVRHAWVAGALEASARAVYAILRASYPDKADKFKREYGIAKCWTSESLYEQLVLGFKKSIPEYPPSQ
ncbi:hypothetical protein BDP27DRAFT_1368643 [Rhodocollybia butyracea]|uniref:Amine oxidase domain-containing protein n=1 Tax=Rhodocollybia butyracea TaxID=206335 RepID=A0A9P5PBR8_9AGAR|nr:hypothetical protein BDP27DRAFT_1368643 [Rhodocollybia butyracea]